MEITKNVAVANGKQAVVRSVDVKEDQESNAKDKNKPVCRWFKMRRNVKSIGFSFGRVFYILISSH